MTLRNHIRSWALAAVAVTSAAMIGFSWWLIDILSAANWCGRAIGAAERSDARPEYAVGGCFNLLNKQVEALALNSHLAIGTLALCLAVLVVIVLAGGRLSFTASKAGVSADVGSDAAIAEARGARKVAGAADEKADEIASKVTPDDPDGGKP